MSRSRGPAARRLLRELRLAQLEPSWGVAAAPASDEDLFTWHCNVAGQPKDGSEPVVLHLELTFPEDYPTRPPKVEVLGSTVRHPNVFSTFICLDMLEGGEWAADEEKRKPYCGWSSAYSVLAILRQLQTFFFEGDGTAWWACSLCTLYNPAKNRRCEACEQPRSRGESLEIQVKHHHGFQCRCGHKHEGPMWPVFPDRLSCDDAPVAEPPPERCPERACVICLGGLGAQVPSGSAGGEPRDRQVAGLVDGSGQQVCRHRLHERCALELAAKRCPVCHAPFERVEALALELSTGGAPLQPQTALRAGARAHMAQLAAWPAEVVVHIMVFLRRPERAALSSAVPVWQDAVHAPVFWEAQELQCFHEKTGPDEDVIGIGVHASGRGRLAKLTAHFDAVSRTAWHEGLRRAAWKEPMSHWLPLYIHRAHAQEALPFLQESLALLAQCVPVDDNSHLPPSLIRRLVGTGLPEDAVRAIAVLPELMHQLVKQVLDGDRHASLKVLKGYFVLHRLFLHACELWPVIRQVADDTLRAFVSSAEQRTKAETPWLAYILQLLTVSNMSWDDVKTPFVEEVLARSVQFTRATYPHYRPVDPDACEAAPALGGDGAGAAREWEVTEEAHGSEKDPGTVGAEELAPDLWRGRPRGWCCLFARPLPPAGRHAFSVRVQRLPQDAVLRIGWQVGEAAGPFGGWCYYASPGCFGGCGWKARAPAAGGVQAGDADDGSQRQIWEPYGQCFQEGDLLVACVDRGVMSFQRNGVWLGVAFAGPADAEYRPFVAIRRFAEVEMRIDAAAAADTFTTPEQVRDMAWGARLNRRGYMLVLFQVLFLSLVRPQPQEGGGGTVSWDALKHEYDSRLGFPSSRLSAALVEHFGEVHRVVSLRGSTGWPAFFRMLGLDEPSPKELDRWLFAAYQRANALNYRMGGRHDHA